MNQGHHSNTRCRQHGFTIIELMITLTLVAVLAGIAVPSMRTYVLNGRISSTAQDLLRSLQTARSEATKQQLRIVLCASANPAAATPTCTTGTATGWITFVDTDRDWQHSATEQLLETHSFDSTLHVLADQSHLVGYDPTGFASPPDPPNATPSTAIVICDSRGNVDSNGGTTQTDSVARGIIITSTGRARITKVRNSSTDSNDISDLLGSAKINSSCPP